MVGPDHLGGRGPFDPQDPPVQVRQLQGCQFSSATDLSNFYRALLSGRLLTPHLLREMKTTVAEDPSDPNTTFRYGLGLQRVNDACGAN